MGVGGNRQPVAHECITCAGCLISLCRLAASSHQGAGFGPLRDSDGNWAPPSALAPIYEQAALKAAGPEAPPDEPLALQPMPHVKLMSLISDAELQAGAGTPLRACIDGINNNAKLWAGGNGWVTAIASAAQRVSRCE